MFFWQINKQLNETLFSSGPDVLFITKPAQQSCRTGACPTGQESLTNHETGSKLSLEFSVFFNSR